MNSCKLQASVRNVVGISVQIFSSGNSKGKLHIIIYFTKKAFPDNYTGFLSLQFKPIISSQMSLNTGNYFSYWYGGSKSENIVRN